MEKNIPGLKKQYNICLSKLRRDKPTADDAGKQLTYWSSRYIDAVTYNDSTDNTEHERKVYGAILEAYARREALKQYIEEIKGGKA